MSFDSRLCSLVALVLLVGCGSTAGPAPLPVKKTSGGGSTAAADSLEKQIDDALDFTYARRLDTSVNAAWQIIHGCIPFKQEFLIRNNGEDVRAIEFLFGG